MARKDSAPQSSAIRLCAVERIIFYVRDLERSAKWYADILGIPARHKEVGWAELDTKGLISRRMQNPAVRRMGIYRRSDRTSSPASDKFAELLRVEAKQTLQRLGQS